MNEIMNEMMMVQQIEKAIQDQKSSRKEVLKCLTRLSAEALKLLRKLNQKGFDPEGRICIKEEKKLENYMSFNHVRREEVLSLINNLNNCMSEQFKDMSIIFAKTNTLRDVYYNGFFQQLTRLSEILDEIEETCKKLGEIQKRFTKN